MNLIQLSIELVDVVAGIVLVTYATAAFYMIYRLFV